MELLKPSPPNSFPLTPLTFLERAALVYGDCTSIVYNISYTWSQTLQRCLSLASSLSSILRINRGDVVSVVASNIPAMYEIQFAVPMAGAILNNINTRLDARTISVILLHGESKLVIVDQQLLPIVAEAMTLVSERTRSLPKLVLIEDDEVDALEARLSRKQFQIAATYEYLVRKGDPKFKWVWPLSDWSPMVLNYTSGTTADTKGVVDENWTWGLAGQRTKRLPRTRRVVS